MVYRSQSPHPPIYSLFFVAVCGLILSLPCEAKRFRNSYISFELPPNWECQLEGTEWVCIHQYTAKSNKPNEAIIILTAKEVGPSDSFAAYKAHLETPRSLPVKSGPPQPSKVIHVRERKISNQPWIDGMHLGSEIGTYYTRYLATLKERIAILITFSAHKEAYTKYTNDFLKAIDSLTVVASKELLASRRQMDVRRGQETIGAPIGQNIPLFDGDSSLPPEPKPPSKTLDLLLLILVIGAVGIFVWLRRKRPKAKGPKGR